MSPPSKQSEDDLIFVARAVRTRGLKGELVADLLTDFPSRFETLQHLFGVTPGGERKLLDLEKVWVHTERVRCMCSG